MSNAISTAVNGVATHPKIALGVIIGLGAGWGLTCGVSIAESIRRQKQDEQIINSLQTLVDELSKYANDETEETQEVEEPEKKEEKK